MQKTFKVLMRNEDGSTNSRVLVQTLVLFDRESPLDGFMCILIVNKEYSNQVKLNIIYTATSFNPNY